VCWRLRKILNRLSPTLLHLPQAKPQGLAQAGSGLQSIRKSGPNGQAKQESERKKKEDKDKSNHPSRGSFELRVFTM
jgi:hypothetical protein